MPRKPPAPTPHLRLRVDAKLLDRLEKSRMREGRTLTGEIVTRLEQSFQRDEKTSAKQMQEENDSVVLGLLVRNNESAADLLRKIVFEIQAHPDWDTTAGRQRLAETVREFINPLAGEGAS